jgi:hypothetical protein
MGGHRNGGNSQHGDGTERHQCLLHGLTFLMGAKDSSKSVLSVRNFHISPK